MFEPQPVTKSPLVAFLLSLAFPGPGQIYCGKTSRGLWTLAIFLPALTLTACGRSTKNARAKTRCAAPERWCHPQTGQASALPDNGSGGCPA